MPRAGEPLGGARLHATGNAADLRRALALSPTPAAHTGGRLIYQADGWLTMVAAVDKKRPFKLVAMFRPESVTTQSATPTARMASFAGTSSSVSSNREVLSEEVLMMPFHVGRTPITRWCASGTRDWSKEFPRKGTHVPSIDFTDPRGDLRGGRATRGTGRPSRRGPRPRPDARSQP